MIEQTRESRSPQRLSGWAVRRKGDRWEWRAWCGTTRDQGEVDTEGDAIEHAQAAERLLSGAV